jgi:adenylate cyclase
MGVRITYFLNGTKEEHFLSNGSTSVGRGMDNDIIITDFSVSRRHATFTLTDATLQVADDASRNGTFVNGRKIKSRMIKAGDEVCLGRFIIHVDFMDKPKSVSEDVVLEERPFKERPGTIIKPMTGFFDEKVLVEKKPTTSLFDGELKKVDEDAGDVANILRVLSQVAKTLISADSLDEILKKVVDLTFEHISIERCVLMLHDRQENTLVPKIVRHAKDKEDDQLVISKTITEKVFKEHVSILTSDASIDPRFSASESIIFQGIRSAMCVPLWNDGDVVGVLYVDSLMANQMYVSENLDLLTALANYAAVAIQRARLHEQVQTEMNARAKLARYHSPNVVSKILASKEEGMDWNINAQEREVSVLFSDIVGFTTLSERLSPTQVGNFLNYYFGHMTSIVFKHEGTLDKFMGDALMAVFGAPISQKDHEFRAVCAALEMREQLAHMNFKEEMGIDIDLHIRIGINSGMVVAGDIGSPQRMEYTVIGDTVNSASRLEEDVAGVDEIVIGEETWIPIQNKFQFEEMGKINLRGRRGETCCYKVIEKKAGLF